MTPIIITLDGKRYRALDWRRPIAGEPFYWERTIITPAVDQNEAHLLVEPITPARITFEECEDSPGVPAPGEYFLDQDKWLIPRAANDRAPWADKTRRVFRLIEGEL